jgi:hypothetical protein
MIHINIYGRVRTYRSFVLIYAVRETQTENGKEDGEIKKERELYII